MRIRGLVHLACVALAFAGCGTAKHTARSATPLPANPAAGNIFLGDANVLPPNPYEHLRATGKAAQVLRAARSQMDVPYIFGAQPRSPEGLRAVGLTARRHGDGFDCSSFVAYAFEAGLGEWVSGTIAHTDQIWTQGGRLPLNMTPGQTDTIVRGTGDKPPRGGYRPGDILLLRWGSGGYFGHTVLVSEHGLVIQSLPPGVYETTPITEYLAEPEQLGWVRVRALSQA
ncbi:MAG: C40 family peptidase [Thermoleophilia bacterium]|nr:C40 family peptidase [Thermoleophilia bacterium]